MKSSIRIDFVDRGTGKGIEPVIKVEIANNSEDPRDKLISHLFQSVQDENFMEFYYNSYSADSKTVLLFKPEMVLSDTLSYRVLDNSTGFHDFLKELEIDFTPDGHYTIVRDTKYGAFLLGQKLQAYKVAKQS